MGFFGELGELVGVFVGALVGGATEAVGDIVDNDFIREVGQSVNKASVNAGKTVGQAADGVAGIAIGIVTLDSSAAEEGFENLGNAVGGTVVGIAKGVGHIAENGFNTIEGIIEGDNDKAFNGAKNLAKVVAISTLAIGIGDYIGIIGDDFDGASDAHEVAHLSEGIDIDGDGDIINDVSEVDTPETHDVQAHYVQGHIRGDNFIEGYFRDGDGNTDIDLTEEQGGVYSRSNHDGSTLNNLG